MSDNEIECTARIAYEHGQDPIDYAAWLIGMHLDVYFDILHAREDNPQAYPGYKLSMASEALLRRIVAGLLDAGWQPPKIRPTPEDVSALLPPEQAS
jgi:hypothetical protein